MKIEKLGEYITRNGRKVIISEIKEVPDDGCMYFNCTGHVFIPPSIKNKRKKVKVQWCSWNQETGNMTGLIHNWDIVGEWK